MPLFIYRAINIIFMFYNMCIVINMLKMIVVRFYFLAVKVTVASMFFHCGFT
jgi:hypothetical protein